MKRALSALAASAGLGASRAPRRGDQGPGCADAGEGWFLLPNRGYGPALAGDIDAIFTADRRSGDPAEDAR